MRYLELICFFSFFYLVISKLKLKFIRKVLIFLLSLILFLDLAALLSKNNHLDHSFIANINKEMIIFSFKLFFYQSIGFILFCICWLYFIIKNEIKISKILNNLNKKIYIILLIITGFFTFSSKGVVNSLRYITKGIEFSIKEENRNEILEKLGIFNEHFITKNDLKAEKGKNIIIIYLESLESAFLEMEELTPNLNRLKKEWNYFEYDTSRYSSWTMGAIYATQTGLPMSFGLKGGNEVLKDSTDNDGISIGNILNKAGYNQVFLNGVDLEFAGVGNFFKLNNYKAFGNEDFDESYVRSHWGVQDLDLFNEAKKKYLLLEKENKPFNLTILTIDTHFPNGCPDERFAQIIKNNEKNMEYCIQSIDYLIGDFIEFLKQQKEYENTSIYIMPDHLMMGDEKVTPIIKKLDKKNRKLYLITNEKNIDEYESTDKILYFYDIPKLILNGAKVKTNGKFISDLIPNFNLSFIDSNINTFTKLNNSFYKIKYVKIESDLYLKRRSKNKKRLRIYNNSAVIDKLQLSENKKMIYVFDKQMTFSPAYETSRENPILKTEYGKLFLSLTLKNEDIILELISPENRVYKEKIIKSSKISNLFKKKIFDYEKIKDLSEKVNAVYISDSVDEIIKNINNLSLKDISIKEEYEENHKKIIFYDEKNQIVLREIIK